VRRAEVLRDHAADDAHAAIGERVERVVVRAGRIGDLEVVVAVGKSRSAARLIRRGTADEIDVVGTREVIAVEMEAEAIDDLDRAELSGVDGLRERRRDDQGSENRFEHGISAETRFASDRGERMIELCSGLEQIDWILEV
jgi:hypothetical protein